MKNESNSTHQPREFASAISHSPSVTRAAGTSAIGATGEPAFANRGSLLDFEEMQVWLDAQQLAVDVYSDMRQVKDFSFVDQIKRAVVSIFNNIAEGSERVTSTDFARFLDIAKGSTGEVRSMFRLANRLGFISASIADMRCEQCKSISRQ
jgi:four helix bundle protein